MKKVSIILTSWNKVHFMAFCGMATLNSIRVYTDPKDYELIIIETAGYPLWDGHGTLGLKTLAENTTYIQRTMEEYQGNSADMNQGAKLATGEYLVFIENDVILHENWLSNMLYYFEHDLADIVVPTQYFATWDRMNNWKSQTHEEAMEPGLQEAGMLMMKRDKFWETGGWNDKVKQIYMWKAFKKRYERIRARVITTNKVFISHIGGVSYWHQYVFESETYNKAAEAENKAIEEDK